MHILEKVPCVSLMGAPSHHSNAFLVIVWPYGLSPQLLALLVRSASPSLDIKPVIFLSLLLYGTVYHFEENDTNHVVGDATYKFVTNLGCISLSLVCSLCSSSVFPSALCFSHCQQTLPYSPSQNGISLAGWAHSVCTPPTLTYIHLYLFLPPLLPFQRLWKRCLI